MNNQSSSSKGSTLELVIGRGEGKDKNFRIEDGVNLIGRWDPDSGAFPEIDLEPYDVDAKVSRKHAAITKQGSNFTLEDLGSLNGTFLNRGVRLEPGKAAPIKAGDEIIIGKVFLTVVQGR